jgi:hypothetical protein
MEILSFPQITDITPYEGGIELNQFIIDKLSEQGIRKELVIAKEEFYRFWGKPVPSDPFYDSRMAIFIEWFLVERKWIDGISPLEFLLNQDNKFDSNLDLALFHLLSSNHSLFEIMTPWKKDFLWLRDLINGSDWMVSHWPPFPGVLPGQPIEARLVLRGNKIYFSQGLIIHPFGARDGIHHIITTLKNMPLEKLKIMSFISKLQIRSYRYSHLSVKRFFEVDDPLVRDIANEYKIDI